MQYTIADMRRRISVRTYDGNELDPDKRKLLDDLALEESVAGPMGTTPALFLMDAEETGGVRIGTYGFIKGVRSYLAGVMKEEPVANVDFGYRMEGLVIAATSLGLGTCWLGGSFNRMATSARMRKLGANGVVPALVSVGVSADAPAFLDSFVRSMSKGTSRKDPSEIFFDGRVGVPLSLSPGDPVATALECVRGAPSASNKQPWRIVRNGGALHLFLKEDFPYNSVFGAVKMQDIDMGIAMRHFDIAAAELGIAGSWNRLSVPNRPSDEELAATKPLRYIATRTLA